MSTVGLIALALLVAITVPWFVLSAWRRLVLFVGGTLVTAGSSAGVTGPELLFVVLLAALGLASIDRLGKARKKGTVTREAHRVLLAAKIIALATFTAAVVGVARGAAELDVLRAAIPYVTLVLGILVGLDFGTSNEVGRLGPLIYTAALASSLSFMLFYVNARGVADATAIPILPSILLAGLVVAFAISEVLTRGRRWAGPAMAISLAIAGPVLSGGRTAVALLAGFLVLLKQFHAEEVRKARMLLAGAVAVLVAFPVVATASAAFGTQQWLVERFAGLSMLFGDGLSSDLSGESRIARYGVAWQKFQENPILGVGFGEQYFDGTRFLRYLDTPLMHLAVFGAIGFAGLLFAILVILRACYLSASAAGSASGRVFVIATGLIWAALAPLSAPMEDRGFAVAVSLLVAATFGASKGKVDVAATKTQLEYASPSDRNGRRS